MKPFATFCTFCFKKSLLSEKKWKRQQKKACDAYLWQLCGHSGQTWCQEKIYRRSYIRKLITWRLNLLMIYRQYFKCSQKWPAIIGNHVFTFKWTNQTFSNWEFIYFSLWIFLTISFFILSTGTHLLYLCSVYLISNLILKVACTTPNIDYSHNMRILKIPRETPKGSFIYRLKGSSPLPIPIYFGVRESMGERLLDIKSSGFRTADVYLRSTLDVSQSGFFRFTI